MLLISWQQQQQQQQQQQHTRTQSIFIHSPALPAFTISIGFMSIHSAQHTAPCIYLFLLAHSTLTPPIPFIVPSTLHLHCAFICSFACQPARSTTFYYSAALSQQQHAYIIVLAAGLGLRGKKYGVHMLCTELILPCWTACPNVLAFRTRQSICRHASGLKMLQA